jgi:hypothetical protein
MLATAKEHGECEKGRDQGRMLDGGDAAINGGLTAFTGWL